MTIREERDRSGEPRVVRLGEELVEYCGRAEAALGGRWRAVNDHLQRAAASALANTGEALDELNPGDRTRLFRYALRSCGECQRCLRGLEAVQAISSAMAAEGQRRIKDLKLDLYRLIAWSTHAPPRSPIVSPKKSPARPREP